MIGPENLPESHRKLSILRNAEPGFTTYYTGENAEDLAHLRSCSVLLKPGFGHLAPEGVNVVETPRPQVAFYRLSKGFEEDYLPFHSLEQKAGAWIHPEAQIHPSASIGTGCVIGPCCIGPSVKIGPNCTIYAKSVISNGVEISAGSVIGASGMMWAWDGQHKVFLSQLGSVRIEAECNIGSNVTIVRGNANEETVIGKGSCIAHGSMIGHGCQIGPQNHLANSVALGGSVSSGAGCFFGSGSVVSPSTTLTNEVVLGAGAVLTSSATRSGIYLGLPAKWKSELAERMSGIPKWK